VGDELLAHGGAGAGDKVERTFRHAGVEEAFGELESDVGRVCGRLEDDGIARRQRRTARPARQRERKLNGLMTAHTP
jgi:hypothetical protein